MFSKLMSGVTRSLQEIEALEYFTSSYPRGGYGRGMSGVHVTVPVVWEGMLWSQTHALQFKMTWTLESVLRAVDNFLVSSTPSQCDALNLPEHVSLKIADRGVGLTACSIRGVECGRRYSVGSWECVAACKVDMFVKDVVPCTIIAWSRTHRRTLVLPLYRASWNGEGSLNAGTRRNRLGNRSLYSKTLQEILVSEYPSVLDPRGPMAV